MKINKVITNEEIGYTIQFQLINKKTAHNISLELNLIYDTLLLIDIKAKFKEFEKVFMQKIYGESIRVVNYLTSDNWISTDKEKIIKFNLGEVENIDIIYLTYLDFVDKINFIKSKKELISETNLYLNENLMLNDLFAEKINHLMFLNKQHKFKEAEELINTLYHDVITELIPLYNNEEYTEIIEIESNKDIYFSEDKFEDYLNLFLSRFICDYNLSEIKDFFSMLKLNNKDLMERNILFLKRNPEYKIIVETIEEIKQFLEKFKIHDLETIKQLDSENLIILGKLVLLLCDKYSVFFNIPKYSLENDGKVIENSLTNYGSFPSLASTNKLNYNLQYLLNQINQRLLNYHNDLNIVSTKHTILKEIESNISLFNKTRMSEIYYYLVQYLDILRFQIFLIQ